MNKLLSLIFYFIILSIFGYIVFSIVKQGNLLQQSHHFTEQITNKSESAFLIFTKEIILNFKHPMGLLLLQIIIIILFAKIFGFVFKKLHQPAVIGEIVAGIVLGPSILGLFFPQISSAIFPISSLINIQYISQLGLILFMFVVGMELELAAIKKQAYGAFIISHVSIIIPFTLGIGLAYFLYQQYAPTQVSFLSFALFMGISLSITAFPVLARILQEKNITKTKLGSMALTSAAIGDITAWFILAAIIAIVKSASITSISFSLFLAALYITLMILFIKPLLLKLSTIYFSKKTKQTLVIALVFLILLISAYITEIIGIHPLFGAFFVGVLMPPMGLNFRQVITEKIEDVSIVLLLPLFFVFNGLRTQVGLLNTASLWQSCCWVILVAVIGKIGGTLIAAKAVGQTWKESISLGILMNTRGLMELIVLNIGYDLGILSPQIFTMMVIMAIITTFMTGPSLEIVNWISKRFFNKSN